MKLLKKLSCWIFKTHKFMPKILWDECIWCREIRESPQVYSYTITKIYNTGEKIEKKDFRLKGYKVYRNDLFLTFLPTTAPKHRQVAKQPKLSLNKKTSKGAKT